MKNSDKDTHDPSMITVAVIDDDFEFRESLIGCLQASKGFACVGSFASTECALVQLAQSPPNIVLVDINLPGLSGIECVRSLKPRIPNTQFVMITVYDDSDCIFNALSVGATGYLLKRSSLEEILTSLSDVQAGGSPMSSNIARKVVQFLRQSTSTLNPSDKLSKRENEALVMLARGYRYREIADEFGVSIETVNTCIRRIYGKLQVHTRSQAVAGCDPNSVLPAKA